jgi:hypothetical protein
MVGYVSLKRDSHTLQDHQHWQALVIPSWFQDGFPYIHYVQYFDYGLNFSRERRTTQPSTSFWIPAFAGMEVRIGCVCAAGRFFVRHRRIRMTKII